MAAAAATDTASLASPTVAAAAGGKSSGPSINTFSSGLLQISGISTLIGSNGLAEMCLGLKAAPGLAWSSVSCFGILQAVRAFVAGTIPDTWRDVVDLRTDAVDDALGFSFWTDVGKPIAGRTMQSRVRLIMQQRGLRLAEERQGIWLGVKSEFNQIRFDTPGRLQDHFLGDKLVGWHSLLAPDRTIKSTLATTSTFGDEESIYVICFIPDDTAHDYWLVDWVIIAASMLKISEAVTLYRMGSFYLWWSSMMGSACCLLFAVLLQVLNSGRDSYGNLGDVADFVIGDLPSYKRFPATDKKIILGQPVSVRRSALWRTAWAVGTIANAVGVGITFYILAKEVEESAALAYVWLSFQILWVFLRIFVHRIIPESRGAPNLNLTPQPLENVSATAQTRVLRLLLATSLLQTHEHVRFHEAYLEDIQSMSSPQQLIGALQQAGWQICDVLPDQMNQALGTARIEAVIGEGLLRTFAWISKTKIDNAEIYDAVSVLFRASSGERYLVPGVRVMALRPIRPVAQDPEATVPCFDPRGTVYKEKTGYWVYWFPMQSAGSNQCTWLEIRCEPFSVLGDLRGYRVLTGIDLEEELKAGTLSISFRGTADMLSALEASRACSRLLLKTVKSLRICRTT